MDRMTNLNFKKQLEHTRKYADAFWNHEMLDRPYVAVTAPLQKVDFDWSPAAAYRACMNEDYDRNLKDFEQVVQNTYYAGEALPALTITLGPDQYATFFGAGIETSAEAFTTWAVPCVKDWADFEVVLNKSKGSYYDKIRKYYAYAADFCKDKFLLNVPDLHSNMDALSALRGSQDLCMDLYDCPEEVHRVLNEIRKTYVEIYNMTYDAGNMKEVGTIGWSPIYCAGKSAVIQCDYCCMLGPEQGKEFVFPAIAEEAAYLDHCVYHLDGKGALVHLDTILAIDEIDCIQWVPGAGQPPTYAWMDVLKKIQAAGKSLWIYDWDVEQIKAFHKELQPDKVAYSLGVDTPEEAEELLEYLTKNT